MLLMTVLVNAGLVYLGNEIGHVRAATMHAAQDGETPFTFTAPRLAASAAHPPAPIPLTAHPNNYIIVNGKPQPHSSETDQMLALARDMLARYQTSPFAREAGKA